ncbi:MAG: beta-agarase [Candidatus Nealsonbacteria bacterium]|nr:beta-agarase [Candidatus Nealsonbacteria bacterium]
MKHRQIRFAQISGLAAACILATATACIADEVLFRFDGDFDLASVEARDTQLLRRGKALRVTTGHRIEWPGITLEAPDGRWDLSGAEYLTIDLENVGTGEAKIFCRIDSASGGSSEQLTESIELKPGQKMTWRIRLRKKLPEQLRGKLFGMRGYPGGWDERRGIDPAHVTQLLLFMVRPTEDHVFEVTGIRAIGSDAASPSADAEKLFPMIDRYGQYAPKDWPGKTKSADDLTQRRRQEAADLKAHAAPDGWNQYGGWQAGPQREVTGRFRAEKVQGKWWLVDPEGRLFWSHGADCVRSTSGYTPITDREHWFVELPAKDSRFGPFYGRGSWAPHGYYQGKRYETFNFTGANLLRKYGEAWRPQYAELCHRRLRSWGMNTVANWSDPEIYLLRKTPYTANIGAGSKQIEGSQGYWGKFPDPFDPSFAEGLKRSMAAEKDKAVGDRWCVGYFVSNELSWGDELSLATATLASPPEQAAKGIFVDDLRQKYTAIGKLNEIWGTKHASWDALLESTTPPDQKKAREDLEAFYTRVAEQYFRLCREAIKAADPQGLYLGCRFAWANDRAVRASAKYCDVVSFNKYDYSVADFRLPDGVDKPVVIGEFHFGALDRGMFHTGLKPVADQAARAEAYKSYVRGALANPWIVGTHWFQYGDQATTGRGDGENYQIGLLDICDTPYPETVTAVRAVGYDMYRVRAGE